MSKPSEPRNPLPSLSTLESTKKSEEQKEERSVFTRRLPDVYFQTAIGPVQGEYDGDRIVAPDPRDYDPAR